MVFCIPSSSCRFGGTNGLRVVNRQPQFYSGRNTWLTKAFNTQIPMAESGVTDEATGQALGIVKQFLDDTAQPPQPTRAAQD